MTNALDKTNAAAQANSRLARLARRGVVLAVLACTGIGAAQAQYHGRRDDAQMQPPPSVRGERLQAPPPQIEQPREQRGYEQMREQMREQQQQRAFDEQRRQAAQMQNDPNREGSRRGRLTPDERRDLRRQINEAGMDIYPNAQRR
ncbi:hypothetical protein [Massilia suwonensis]|uniref:DUF4148 domain-containing protein n=1 Tax=Massilia suwonensis TaxID=648895 RepID=A0ABW0MLX7_9BURK